MDHILDNARRLLASGQHRAAKAAFDRILAEVPDSTGALHGAALVAHATGDGGTAITLLSRAVTIAPQAAAPRLDLGRLLAGLGRLEDALPHFEAAVRSDPRSTDAQHLLGVTLDRLGRPAEALGVLRMAAALAPDAVHTLELLADLEFRVGEPADAVTVLARLVQLRPGDVHLHLRLGESWSRQGHHSEALAVYVAALARLPGHGDLLLAAAQAHEDLGDRTRARDGYAAAVAADASSSFALASLLSLERERASDTLLAQVRDRLSNPALGDEDRALLGFPLGRALDARRAYDDAWTAWVDANAARRRVSGGMDTQAFDAHVRMLSSISGPEALPSPSHPSAADERPVFIVGMPRSGTTLTEQIIASHADAHGAGELVEIPQANSRLASPFGVGDWLSVRDRISPDAFETEARRFLAAAARHARPGATRLVDKAPLNAFQLPLIATLFPAAHVVWCRRDPRDIALSIFGENFAVDATFATDLGDIIRMIDAQDALMRHFRDVLGLPVHVVDYARLVAAPEESVRSLLAFLGLPWDPSCLAFHLRIGGVQTPSRWQVRKPLHANAVARWRAYTPFMNAVIDRYGDGERPLRPEG